MDYEIKDVVVLKCETQKSKAELQKPYHIWDMLLSVATTYSYKDNMYKIWTFSNKDKLIDYLKNKCIICYNGVQFELPLILGEDYTCDPTYIIESKKHNIVCVCIDIFYQILQNVYRVDTYVKVRDMCNKHPIANLNAYSLYNVYCNTLNRQIPKNIYDVKSIEMFKSKKILELVEYDMFKMRFVKELYEYIVRYRYIVNGDYDIVKLSVNTPKEIDFNYFLPF